MWMLVRGNAIEPDADGATTLAAFAAPVVLPVAIAAGAVGLIRSLFD